MKVFRVHSTVTYPDGHPVKEEYVNKSGAPLHSSPAEMANAKERARARVHKVTNWDVVLAPDCEDAIIKVRSHYEAWRCSLTIWSVNHIADLTIGVAPEVKP